MIRPRLLAPMAAVAALLFVSLPAGAGERAPRTVTVSGFGETKAPPDAAEIRLAAVATNKTARAAMAEASRRGQAIEKALASGGVARIDIQTERAGLEPVFEPRRSGAGAPRITGYRATLRSRVVVRDLETLGALLDGLVAAGANEMGALRFFPTEVATLKRIARKDAMADARRAAETLALAAKARIKRVLKIEELGGAVSPLAVRGLAAEAAGVPISPGVVAVRARVRVVYEIEDAPWAVRKAPQRR